MTQSSSTVTIDRAALLDRFDRIRVRTRMLFDLVDDEAYYQRPIGLRNPVVFYEGHLPAFAVNTLMKKGLGQRGVDSSLETIFARGIDPETEAAATARGNPAWPARAAVRDYGDAAERLLRRAIATADFDADPDPVRGIPGAVSTILEHEEMHQETLAYMWHKVPYRQKRKPPEYVTATLEPRSTDSTATIPIPAGVVTLGTDLREEPFAWDNELPPQLATVAAFEIDRGDVTNADYMAFVEAGGYRDARWWRPEDWAWIAAEGVNHPPFWEHDAGAWHWRGMFERVALPGSWPVYVTWAEASAYATWRGRRLPTEAEVQRAARGTPTVGNLDFARWDPVPAGTCPDAVSVYGVYDLVGNGWEWTSTVFAPFPGFEKTPLYPEYSSEFFDGEHYVLKGASPVTARELVRPGFRNWFRPRYPYVYAAFRCVRSL